METIAFPGLGIGEFTINSVAFTINLFGLSLPIRWYGIIIAFGAFLGALYCTSKAKRYGVTADDVLDSIIIGGPLSIIGARLYYVIFNFHEFSSFKDVISIRNGGLAVYGFVITIILIGPWYCKWKKIKMTAMLDLVSFGIIIGQAVGRWGNFMNVEAYGVRTSLPWRMEITENYSRIAVHPTFLYESLWCLLGFALLHFYSKKRRFDGEIFLMYMGWYGFGRAFIESLRTDSLMLGAFKISQILGILFFAASLVVLIIAGNKVKRRGGGQQAYAGLFDNANQTENTEKQEDVTENAPDEKM